MSGPEPADLSTEDWPDDELVSALAVPDRSTPDSAPPERSAPDWLRRVVPVAAAVAVVVVLARRARR